MNMNDQATTSQFAVLAYNANGMPSAGQTMPAGWERIADESGGSMVSGPFAAFAYRNTISAAKVWGQVLQSRIRTLAIQSICGSAAHLILISQLR